MGALSRVSVPGEVFMDQQTQTYIVYALLVVLGFVIGRVTAHPRPEREQRSRPAPPPVAPLVDRDLENQVVLLLRQRSKVEAVKLYREHTGVGLGDAKAAVEGIAARRHLDLG
jgi:ribosomal protein L7/L12